ncbi:MAG TPA: serine/threonine-protein kinase, partial [Gemmataceae bacterium]|nr:serine/threonine-protein kinase [Gemmataceae bacterium]
RFPSHPSPMPVEIPEAAPVERPSAILPTPGQAAASEDALKATQPDPALHGAARADTPAAANSAPAPESKNGGPSAVAVNPANNGSGLVLRTLGDVRILRRLGGGGMGSVYLGYHEEHKCQVAVKVLSERLAGNEAALARFYREARSVTLLNHANIVRGLAMGRDAATGRHFMVLEYVDGPSAEALLDRFGSLGVADAVHIVLDIARALEYLHSRNFVHRDIKPGNILITESGVAKLADLGLAKSVSEASHLTANHQGFGTPYYMPYEQAVSARQVDGRGDIYALGATLYHLVAGEVPFRGENPLEIVEKKFIGNFLPASSLNPDVPAALDRILDKMLAREPADRYQTASELIIDLERSNLAAAVPSFVDPEQALQDPVIRERLMTAAQPTCPDLRVSTPHTGRTNGQGDVWYLRYQDRDGKWRRAKGKTAEITARLRQRRMPKGVQASRHPQGPFRPLKAYADFKKARPQSPAPPQPAPLTPPADRVEPASGQGAGRGLRWPILVSILIGLGLLAAGVAAYTYFLAM